MVSSSRAHTTIGTHLGVNVVRGATFEVMSRTHVGRLTDESQNFLVIARAWAIPRRKGVSQERSTSNDLASFRMVCLEGEVSVESCMFVASWLKSELSVHAQNNENKCWLLDVGCMSETTI